MSRTTRLWILVVPSALAVGAAASALILASDHLRAPGLQALVNLVVGGSFITAGLVARTHRPANRTGLLLIAVGLTWLLSTGLMASDDSLVWTIGLTLSAIPAGFLIHLLMAYPNGRLESGWEQILVVIGYLLVAEAHFVLLPFDPDPLSCADSGCPSNAFLISELATWAVQLVAVASLAAVVATLVGRAKHASPAARRAMAPVLLTGATTLFLFALSVGLRSFSESASMAFEWTASVVVIGVPVFFLTGLLKGRLARADISRVLAEEPSGGVQERVRDLLHDPTAGSWRRSSTMTPSSTSRSCSSRSQRRSVSRSSASKTSRRFRRASGAAAPCSKPCPTESSGSPQRGSCSISRKVPGGPPRSRPIPRWGRACTAAMRRVVSSTA